MGSKNISLLYFAESLVEIFPIFFSALRLHMRFKLLKMSPAPSSPWVNALTIILMRTTRLYIGRSKIYSAV